MKVHGLGGGTVTQFGHHGRPFIVFPSEGGTAFNWRDEGMIDAVGDLLAAGRVKLYCVDSMDASSWSDESLPRDERFRRHERYEGWIHDDVFPFVSHDCGGAAEVALAGCSMGAFHAAHFALKRADRFPLALCFSGNYGPLDGWAALEGDHLEWLRARLNLLLVVGQGQWEDSTGSLDSTKWFAALLRGKGLNVELDVWGHDIPHDWPSWRRQLAHHLPRFC